jgi:hypothetical protein
MIEPSSPVQHYLLYLKTAYQDSFWLAYLCQMYQAQKQPSESYSSSVTQEQGLVSLSMSQRWRLERLRCVLQDWSKCFVGNNRRVEGIDAGGTESCFNIGKRGCFIPCICGNPAKSLLRECAICVMVIKQQNLFISVVLKCVKGNMAKVWLYNAHTPCLIFERILN